MNVMFFKRPKYSFGFFVSVSIPKEITLCCHNHQLANATRPTDLHSLA